MKIKNVSTETSSYTLVVMSIIVSVITALLVWGYILTSDIRISFGGFFKWLFDMFQALREVSVEPFSPWIILIMIIGVYIGFIACAVSKYKALKQFNSELNIKYIDLLPNGIAFFFTRPENNFKCAYEDIKNLYMNIYSTLVHTKNGSYIAFQQLNLTFTDSNDKKYKMSNTTRSPIKLIYKIIDHTRRVQNFEYEFSGRGEIPDYREKIDKYLHLGYKDLVGKDGETNLKLMSIFFFIFGLVFLISFIDVLPRMIRDSGLFFAFLPCSLFLIASFICDIILIVDKIRDNKYRGYNG